MTAKPMMIPSVLGFALLDQASKLAVEQAMTPGESIALWPDVFHLTLTYNTGVAFSLLNDHPAMLIGLTSIIFLCFAVYALLRRNPGRFETLSLALVLGGALGNLIDRVRLGHVVDFLDVTLIHYPVFNVADSLIFLGVLGLLVVNLRAASREDTRAGRSAGE